MNRHLAQSESQALREDVRRLRVCYEVYPEIPLDAADEHGGWFEIALHAQVAEPHPSDHPNSREVFSTLMRLAEVLIQRIQSHAPYGLDLSPSYHTLHAPEGGDFSQTRLSKTVSLVFSNLAPRTHLEEPRILTQIQAELRLLDVPLRDRYRTAAAPDPLR
jgi:hypothetical protein